MKQTLGILSGIFTITTLAVSVHGQNLTLSLSTTDTWIGTPAQATGPTPVTGNGGTTQDNGNWGGDAGGTGGFGTLAQSFELGSAGTLQNIQMVFAGSPVNFNIELYDLGAYPTSGYPSVPQQFTPSGNVLAAGDNFSFTGVASGQMVLTLALGGADANINLKANELYVLALDPTANADTTWWVRGGVPTVGGLSGSGLGYNADGGAGSLALQNFEGKTSIRDFDTAFDVVTTTPEPSSLALLGCGSIAGIVAARRRNK